MDSIREAITAAVAKAEAPDDDAVSSASTIGTDEPGDAAPIGGANDSHVDPADASTDAGSVDAEGSTPTISASPSEPALNAPASWTKEEREAWGAVSPAAQKAVLRREGEMQRSLQSNAQARKRAETFDQIGTQYKPLLDHYNTTMEAVLPPLLATRAALEVGTDEQKATLVANICADFGIPIELLDNALSARFQNGTPQRVQPPQQINYRNIPELAPIFALAEQVKQGREAQAVQALAPLLAQPHYEEVRFTMADLIEKARDSGRNLDVNKAYQLACGFHGLDAPVAALAGSTTVSQAAAILARSRNAASSVAGSPQPTPPRKPGEGSVADEVSALMNAARR